MTKRDIATGPRRLRLCLSIVGWLGPALLFPQSGSTEQVQAPASPIASYRVGAGDVLLIIVDEQPELSGSFAVGRDGTILMPLIHRVVAHERTTGELEKEIAERLAKDFLVDPKVSVGIREYNSRQAYLMIGEEAVVSRLIGPKGTLSELLLQSGIPAKVFSLGEAVVTRAEAEEPGGPPSARVVATVDLKALMLDGELRQDVRLRRGDVIRIPSPESRFVYLLAGDEPAASVPLGPKGTLSELLLEARLPSAAFTSGTATVTRTAPEKPGDPPQAREVATVDLNQLMVKHDLGQECVLQHGDIVRIPSAASRAVYIIIGEMPPVSVPLGEKCALRDVLLEAKVPSKLFAFGSATVTRTLPLEPGKAPEAKVVAEADLKKLMQEHDLSQDVELKNGDIVHIPSPAHRVAHLMLGEDPVLSVEIGEKGTLSELLREGKVPAAVFAIGRASVTRADAEGTAKLVAEVDLAGLMLDHNEELDVKLQPGDFIRIPEATSKFVYLLIERAVIAPRIPSGEVRGGARDRGPGQLGRPGPPLPHIEKLKHPLGERTLLSQVLLDANVEPELFETCVAVVSRREAHKAEKDGKTTEREVVTSAVADLYELILQLDQRHEIDLVPNDLVHLLPRRKVRSRGYAYSLGAVREPGAYECRRQFDARQLIEEAGGYRFESLDPGLVIVRGSDGDGKRLGTYAIKNTRLYDSEFLVQPGDTVYVPPPKPPRPDGHVSVLGWVERPGSVKYEKGMTVADALKAAGGCNGVGSLGKIVVKRPEADAVRTTARLLKATLEKPGDGRGPRLAPGDIVLVHP